MTATEQITRTQEVRKGAADVFAHPRNTGLLLFLLAVAIYAGNVALTARWGLRHVESTNFLHPILYAQWMWLAGVSTYTVQMRLRRRECKPLDRDRHAVAVERIDRLTAEMGLKRPPRILVATRLTDQGFAGGTDYFGMRPYLALGPSLLALGDRRDDLARRVFTGIISHELGHLRNRDVLLLNLVVGVRLANAIEAVFFGTVLVLAAILQKQKEALYGLVALLVFALIIEIVSRGFLRARESYADQRAARYRPEELSLALRRDGRSQSEETLWLRLGKPAWWGRHPSPRTRLRHLADPDELLRFPVPYVLLGGLLAGVSLNTVPAVMSIWLDIGPADDLILLTTATLAGAPLGVFVGVGVWRQAWRADEPAGRRLLGLLRNALLLAVGVLVGSHVAPYGLTHTAVPFTPWSLTALVLACLALMSWPHAAARAWRVASPLPDPPGKAQQRLLAGVSALVGFGVFALLPLGAVELLAAYGVFVAAPALVVRLLVCIAEAAGNRTPAALDSRRTSTLATVMGCNAVLVVAGVLIGTSFSWAQDDDRIRQVLSPALLTERLPTTAESSLDPLVREWFVPHWLGLLSLATAVLAVAAFGLRVRRAPGAATVPDARRDRATRLRAWSLLLVPVPLTVVAAAVFRSSDAGAVLYCSPLTAQGSKVTVFMNPNSDGRDQQVIFDKLERFAVRGDVDRFPPEVALRNYVAMNPASPLVDSLTPEQFPVLFRVELPDSADLPRLRTALVRLDLHQPLKEEDVLHRDPCHPLR
ncbi:M48 family metalloprotease [Streptomyces europaeiscabiei]|uniref:M48 family metalloprotease n=1 Tax=Streptomyces europaeiscabiei TaxID=146819 RepID=UPI0029AB467E|nr:M48 family metalloprotease [Streptomyces europaeiscabiei]MDX3848511.1 M48 family metalloprotease [Streptomyces europaeiscabiei]